MKRNRIEKQVARATREDLSVIRRLGFQIELPLEVLMDMDEPETRSPQVVDWDSKTGPLRHR